MTVCKMAHLQCTRG